MYKKHNQLIIFTHLNNVDKTSKNVFLSLSAAFSGHHSKTLKCPPHTWILLQLEKLDNWSPYTLHPPLWSSSFPPACQLHVYHPLSSISTIAPPHMTKPSQPPTGFPTLSSKPNCPSCVLISNFVLTCSLKTETVTSSALPTVFLTVPPSLNHTLQQFSRQSSKHSLSLLNLSLQPH